VIFVVCRGGLGSLEFVTLVVIVLVVLGKGRVWPLVRSVVVLVNDIGLGMLGTEVLVMTFSLTVLGPRLEDWGPLRLVVLVKDAVGTKPGGVYISPGSRGSSGWRTFPSRSLREPSDISMEPSGRNTFPLGSFTDPSLCNVRSPGKLKSPLGFGSCHVPSGI
jgi:hypothetical protein